MTRDHRPDPDPRAPPLLSLKNVNARYGRRQVLAALDLEVGERGAHVLLGPAGTGKSTLLRIICGRQKAGGRVVISGRARYRGNPLAPGNFPVLIGQKPPRILSSVIDFLADSLPNRGELTRLEQIAVIHLLLEEAGLQHLIVAMRERLVDLTFADRTCLAILHGLGSDPALICLDEPTAGMDEASISQVRKLIADQKHRRAVLMVTHHQAEARELGDHVALLAGGGIVEQGPASAFFKQPTTEAGRQFVRTGSCDLPPPGTPKLHLSPESRGPVRIKRAPSSFVADSNGPTGFRWLIDGQLGGAPQPGLIGDLDADLAALRRVGVTVLISLTEKPTVTDAELARHDLCGRWFPIPDMEEPDPEAAMRVCVEAENDMRTGGAVAYHCKAGLGRTGLMLVAHLILRGAAAPQALAFARERKTQWVQSLRQEQFLWDFELFMALKLEDDEAERRK